MRTAWAHLKPGGVLVSTADVTTETFQQNSTSIETSARAGLEVTFIENVYDPDPDDEHYETTIVYLIREQGKLRIEHDHWTLGLFSRQTWRSVLESVGFAVSEATCHVDGASYLTFIGVKPG